MGYVWIYLKKCDDGVASCCRLSEELNKIASVLSL